MLCHQIGVVFSEKLERFSLTVTCRRVTSFRLRSVRQFPRAKDREMGLEQVIRVAAEKAICSKPFRKDPISLPEYSRAYIQRFSETSC
jgi:hypothetical protein